MAADNIAGLDSVYRASWGSSVVKLFDMTAAATGLNERAAKAAGLAYDKVVLSPASHASYYPGGKAMTMKVLYEKGTLRLLGAQIVGFDGSGQAHRRAGHGHAGGHERRFPQGPRPRLRPAPIPRPRTR